MTPRGRDIRNPAISTQSFGASVRVFQGVCGARKIVNGCSEQPVEQDVTTLLVLYVVARDGLRQHEFASQPKASGYGGGQAGVVRLATANGDDCIRALALRVTDEKLQLA
jgi:hypothetical protein